MDARRSRGRKDEKKLRVAQCLGSGLKQDDKDTAPDLPEATSILL